MWIQKFRDICKISYLICIEYMDINGFDPFRVLFNNKPIDDFCGMTHNEIHHLFYTPFDDVSPLKINAQIADDTLNNIPFFRLTEELCKIVQRDKFIKLTPLGALPRKVLHELYNYNFIIEDMILTDISKVNREIDATAIMNAHYTARASRIVKKVKGNLLMTKSGMQLLNPERRNELFIKVLRGYTTEFNWAFNDGYTDFQVGQFGWGFTLFLLYKFGDTERTKQFYSNQFLKAFPSFIQMISSSEYSTPEKDFENCYILRSIERFAEWFGFAEDCTNYFFKKNNDIVKRKDVLMKVFNFEN